MIVGTLVASAALAFPGLAAQAAQQQAAWGNREVEAYIEAHRPSDEEPTDPFAVSAASPAPARNVVLRYPVKGVGGPPRPAGPVYAIWEYNPTLQIMTVKVSRPESPTSVVIDYGDYPSSGLYRERIFGWPTSEERDWQGYQVRQNALGAQVRVSSSWVAMLGLGEIAERQPITTDDDLGYRYQHQWTIAPEEARALSEHLEIQIGGETVEWQPGRWIVCGRGASVPTVRSPYRISRSGCFVSSRLQWIRVVDVRSGAIIHQWNRRAGIPSTVHRPEGSGPSSTAHASPDGCSPQT
jgi:hypothetical protein